MLSEAERRKNEIRAILMEGAKQGADLAESVNDSAWLDALLKVSDEAPDADKEVIWNTVVEIAYIRGWRWSHGEGRWVRWAGDLLGAKGVAAAPDGQIPDSGPKMPGIG